MSLGLDEICPFNTQHTHSTQHPQFPTSIIPLPLRYYTPQTAEVLSDDCSAMPLALAGGLELAVGSVDRPIHDHLSISIAYLYNN